ncbi:hypothetical protein ACH4UV_32935 [Streptomyces sp. NPDC020802]|uniref:hypothetical protein n=1 Tax=Streptomyces sp. NPDC020802 TaxID=3365094 RepID=UPI0037ABE31B
MSQKTLAVAAGLSPFATALPTGVMPWPAELALALSGPLVYLLHRFWMHRLACRALDHAASGDIPTVVAFGSGQQPLSQPPRARRNGRRA